MDKACNVCEGSGKKKIEKLNEKTIWIDCPSCAGTGIEGDSFFIERRKQCRQTTKPTTKPPQKNVKTW